MALRVSAFVLVLAIAILAVIAWNRNSAQNAPAGGGSAPPEEAPANGSMPGGMPSAPAGDPGIAWQTPARWVTELATGMRLASYVIPAPKAGGAAAQCAVYYFGPGQGGGVDANLRRWTDEFRSPGKSSRTTSQVRGMPVSRVEVSGTYTAHAGMGGGPAGEEAGWRLLGAIVEGPKGAVFFKLTGPDAAVAPAAKEFDALIASATMK